MLTHARNACLELGTTFMQVTKSQTKAAVKLGEGSDTVEYRSLQGYLACQWAGKGPFIEGLHCQLLSDRSLLRLTQEKVGGRVVNANVRNAVIKTVSATQLATVSTLKTHL